MKSDAFEVLPDDAMRDRLGRITVEHARREALIDKFRESGLSQAKFCRREGVNPNTFCGWMKRRATGKSSSTGGATSSPTRSPTRVPFFREVAVERSPAPATGEIRVMIPGGVEVRCGDVVTAVNLIRALRENG